MAYCINCGQRLVDGAKFCSNCGQAVNVTNERTQRKNVYEGEIHRCPNCGDIVDAYETICDACGYEIRGRKAASVVYELSVKLEQTNDDKKKDELIRNFYIPNTKEDIHEFFILALSHIKTGGLNTNAWMVKLEQAYQKAELSFADTAEFERLKVLYEKTKVLNKKNAALSFLRGIGKYFKSGYAWALLFCVVGVLFFLISDAANNETLGIVGFGIIAAAAWIAIGTMQSNENKSKK